ncbi:thiamine-phosphate kinase [Granulicella mallensis]|uniref:Thiamine-monophosphate kinase n=1 Tax=Granulicella mallensis (strain ATCC BAA-1857 / DSM 23137 / MP5ACTX8) TaxID=682795 RepID=G8NRX3_GRAMM|nr:thiamine-phosphate kinase [Granulicella mallensis]AEU35086.1 thiamine-monophosphate kinase [Granulicella mallensis MP5ACTX8]
MPRISHPRSSSTPLHEGGELALIERIRRRAGGGASTALRLGIGDDCAILRPRAGEDLLVTTDFSLEGRHFRRDWHSPQSIGHRTLARGLSDLAAMGARPMAAFLSLALPPAVARDAGWLEGFLDGLLDLAKQHGVPLAGGDTSESPSEQVLADIILLGSAPRGRALRRSGARVGDLIYCTGTLGGATAEFAQVQDGRGGKTQTASSMNPHLFPQPRLAAGQALLRRKLATACIDTSDGISTDLAHLCEASGVNAEIDAASLPLHPLAQQLTQEAAMAAALHGGEDYELLFTARAATKMPRKLGGVPLTCIGRVVAKKRRAPQVTLIAADGSRSALAAQGWEHLR